MSILGPLARMPATMSRRMRVRFSNVPPYLPGRVWALEELVQQIAVAMLDVHEVDADVARRSSPAAM